MSKREVVCPYCKHSFIPFGVFMLEKIYCPSCGQYFFVLKYASTIRIIYSSAVFVITAILYARLRPEASAVIAVFWVAALLVIKGLTYILHRIIYYLWSFRDT